MATAGLVLASLDALAAGGLYLAIGRRAARSSFTPQGRPGARMFRFWWVGLAGLSGITGIQGLLAAFAPDAPWLALAATSSQFLYVFWACTALCALMCYLCFLHTGSMRATPLFIAFYAIVYIAGAGSMAYQRIAGFQVEGLAATIRYVNPLPQSGLVYACFYSLLIVPQIVVAALYLAFYRRVGDPIARMRVALVSASLLLLLVATWAAGVTGHGLEGWWLMTQQGVMLATGLGVLAAHRPPAWLRARYGIASAPQPNAP